MFFIARKQPMPPRSSSILTSAPVTGQQLELDHTFHSPCHPISSFFFWLVHDIPSSFLLPISSITLRAWRRALSVAQRLLGPTKSLYRETNLWEACPWQPHG